jgi:hypothetical protein
VSASETSRSPVWVGRRSRAAENAASDAVIAILGWSTIEGGLEKVRALTRGSYRRAMVWCLEGVFRWQRLYRCRAGKGMVRVIVVVVEKT